MILFLDIDGVLNAHGKLPSGYCGIDRDKAQLLNFVLHEVPELQLVISSAWRYMMLRGDMTLKGFEYLLLVHGVHCADRLHGHTEADPVCEADHFDLDAWRTVGLKWRAEQIAKYVSEHKIERYAVVDDLDLCVPNFVRTDDARGLTSEDAYRIIGLLKGERATELEESR